MSKKIKTNAQPQKPSKEELNDLNTCEEIAGDRPSKRPNRKFRLLNRKRKHGLKEKPKKTRKTKERKREYRYIKDEAVKEVDIEPDSDFKDATHGVIDKAGDNAFDCVKNLCRKGLRPILKDFTSVRKFLPPEMTTIMFDRYPAKNRYTDVMCLDKTRVILRDRPGDNDYIHANWVQLSTNKRYICTQGPLEETIEDFWWMIFKEEVKAIVMLCDFIEDGESKCAEYFPLTTGEKARYGGITVKNERNGEHLESVTCQIMSVRLEGDTHQVYHYKFLNWPDHSSPRSGAPVVALIMKLKTLQEIGPVAVHCSAGIGRTGTLCAVDCAIDRLNEEGTVSPPDVVKEIRRQRLHSVQSVMQYLYVHICLIEYLQITKSLTQYPFIRHFRRDYERYLKKYNERLTKEKQQLNIPAS